MVRGRGIGFIKIVKQINNCEENYFAVLIWRTRREDGNPGVLPVLVTSLCVFNIMEFWRLVMTKFREVGRQLSPIQESV